MRSFAFVCAIALTLAMTCAEDILSEKDEELIRDEQWFRKFYVCVMKEGPCPEDVKKFTDRIPTYFATGCASCSQKEKDLFNQQKKLVNQLYPELLANLRAKLLSNN